VANLLLKLDTWLLARVQTATDWLTFRVCGRSCYWQAAQVTFAGVVVSVLYHISWGGPVGYGCAALLAVIFTRTAYEWLQVDKEWCTSKTSSIPARVLPAHMWVGALFRLLWIGASCLPGASWSYHLSSGLYTLAYYMVACLPRRPPPKKVEIPRGAVHGQA
jgi:hypothetical protein